MTAPRTTVPPLPPNAALRWSIVRRTLNRLRPATILEIGVGQGAFGARLARRADYLGIEPDPTSFAIAAERIRANGGRALNIGFDELPAGDRYDLVCSFEVLEHLEDDVAAATAWRESVAPGGHVVLSMPAWQERFNQWDTLVGHYRRYSPDSARAALTSAGFVDVEVVVYGWPLGYALENVRSKVAARRGAGAGGIDDIDGVNSGDGAGDSFQERTAGSGRHFQPRTVAGFGVQAATSPFAVLQRLQPGKGTGVVVIARNPA